MSILHCRPSGTLRRLQLGCFIYFLTTINALASEVRPQYCGSGTVSTIAFVGDLIFHSDLQRIAMAQGATYGQFWSAANSIFRSVDAVYGNLEGTISSNVTYLGERVADPGRNFGSKVYSAPSELLNFNYHPSLARDLKRSGFRVVSTGNNHALDRGTSGIDQTVDRLESAGVVAVGTRHSQRRRHDWGRLTQVGDLNIGWVSCTFGTNGYPDPLDQVLDCYTEKPQTLAAISGLAARRDVDAVFFVPHWGIENQLVIARRQSSLAREAISAGAAIVVGTHPHILQEWDWMKSKFGRAIPIIYSTGNFISTQPLPHQRDGLILIVTLHKSSKGSKAHVVSTRYILTEFEYPPGNMSFVEFDPVRHSVLPVQAQLREGELKRYLGACE